MIELSIFTNCIPTAPNTDIIEKTYKSFTDTFGELKTTIYLDSHPYPKKEIEYEKRLKKIFGFPIVKTISLSDGYIKSIKNSKSEYLFQLEHDWVFLSKYINHSLEDIIKIMKVKNLYHFRFSKHQNTLTPELIKWQTIMNEKSCNGLKYCETDNLSNNPHIIDREFYKNILLNKISLKNGSRGIEEALTKIGLIGCQYGGLNHPKTIQHLQGKKTICLTHIQNTIIK